MSKAASQEKWVQCDCCEKWRRLPGCTEEEYQKLSKRSRWECKQNRWDKGRAVCEATEERFSDAISGDLNKKVATLSENTASTDEAKRESSSERLLSRRSSESGLSATVHKYDVSTPAPVEAGHVSFLPGFVTGDDHTWPSMGRGMPWNYGLVANQHQSALVTSQPLHPQPLDQQLIMRDLQRGPYSLYGAQPSQHPQHNVYVATMVGGSATSVSLVRPHVVPESRREHTGVPPGTQSSNSCEAGKTCGQPDMESAGVMNIEVSTSMPGSTTDQRDGNALSMETKTNTAKVSDEILSASPGSIPESSSFLSTEVQHSSVECISSSERNLDITSVEPHTSLAELSTKTSSSDTNVLPVVHTNDCMRPTDDSSAPDVPSIAEISQEAATDLPTERMSNHEDQVDVQKRCLVVNTETGGSENTTETDAQNDAVKPSPSEFSQFKEANLAPSVISQSSTNIRFAGDRQAHPPSAQSDPDISHDLKDVLSEAPTTVPPPPRRPTAASIPHTEHGHASPNNIWASRMPGHHFAAPTHHPPHHIHPTRSNDAHLSHMPIVTPTASSSTTLPAAAVAAAPEKDSTSSPKRMHLKPLAQESADVGLVIENQRLTSSTSSSSVVGGSCSAQNPTPEPLLASEHEAASTGAYHGSLNATGVHGQRSGVLRPHYHPHVLCVD
eukprot:Lankesteria_metandrocarpae@DN1834_c0_g1_i1.p1